MSGRRFDVADVAEVLVMWQAGYSSREIAGRLRMGRDRIRAIVRRAQSHGYSAEGDLVSRKEWRERAVTMFSERVFPPQSAQRQELDQFREEIERGLQTESAAAVLRRLRDEHGLDVAPRTFRHYASELRGADPGYYRMSTPLKLELSAARQRIRELEAELDSQSDRRPRGRDAPKKGGLQTSA